MKSELAIKRDEWFDSAQGVSCCKIDTLVGNSRYLKNRLERAFLAGAKANEEVNQEICDKLAAPFISPTPDTTE